CFWCGARRRDLHSFPTRRSSDLGADAGNVAHAGVADGQDGGFGRFGVLGGVGGLKISHATPNARPWPLDHFIVLDRHEDKRTMRSEEHTSELQSRENLVCRLLLE